MADTQDGLITPAEVEVKDALSDAVTELLAHEDPTPESPLLREGDRYARWERLSDALASAPPGQA